MNTPKHRVILLFVVVLLCGTFCSATSIDDPVFNFAFSLGGNQGTFSLNTTDLGGGEFWANTGMLDVTAGADIGTYSLIPGGPGSFTSPSGAFVADNLVFPQSNPTLDVFGLLFGESGLEINMWGNRAGNYSFFSFNGSGYNVAFAGPGFVGVPEPASLLLLGVGFLGLAGIVRRLKMTGRH